MKIATLLAAIFFCMGAVDEFPEIEEEPIEEALDEEDYFEEEISYEFDIPKVSERPYGAEELDRLPVEGIVIRGVVPHPENNITQEEIQAVIDQAFEQQRDIELDDNGFTRRDLQDIGRFLREIKDRGDDPDLEDLQDLMDRLNTLELQMGYITIEQLDEIALEATNYYRTHGFILATAFIPEQEVTDGIVYIDVLEGRLGNVTVSNNEVFSNDTISMAFGPELGKSVTEESIESALRRINSVPGLRVRGSFSPGQNTGETSLNLGVLDERSWVANVLLDNHGSETTGEHRLFATTQWLNIGGRGHKLLVGALMTEGPADSTNGLMEYEMPVTKNGRGKVKANINSNQFAVAGFSNLGDIIGETVSYSLTGSYQFLLSRTRNLSAELSYAQKDVLFTVGGLSTLSTDQVIETYSLSANYTQLWDEQLLLLNGRMGIDVGHIISGEANNQSVNFTKILFTTNILKRFEQYNWLTKKTNAFNFVVNVSGQYTDYFLPSVEQFSLGGPTAVRGFGSSDVSADSGIYIGFDLFFNLPFDVKSVLKLPVDTVKPFVFYDYAYGVAMATGTGGSNRDAEIKGYGFGMRVGMFEKVTANLIFAKPHSHHYENVNLDAFGSSRWYVDFTYQIN